MYMELAKPELSFGLDRVQGGSARSVPYILHRHKNLRFYVSDGAYIGKGEQINGHQ
jgi:hypothetical protein